MHEVILWCYVFALRDVDWFLFLGCNFTSHALVSYVLNCAVEDGMGMRNKNPSPWVMNSLTSEAIHHPGYRIIYSSPEVILRTFHIFFTFVIQIVTLILIHFINFDIKNKNIDHKMKKNYIL